jgi:Asp/Glu/hydantoin racemase
MAEYSASPDRYMYGQPLGILMLNCRVPFVPGDIGNASTFKYPVLYSEVKAATINALLINRDPTIVSDVIREAEFLVSQGVRAITSSCGYFAMFQDAVADAIRVPVFLSSLMQIPLLQTSLGPKKLGIIVAHAATFDDSLLTAVGVRDTSSLVITGLDNSQHFQDAIMTSAVALSPVILERDVVKVATQMQRDNPDIAAILLECSDLPPYASAIQKATGLPTFDWVGFADYVVHAVAPPTYAGIF